MPKSKADRRLRAKRSIRRKISGTAERPRLTVYRSNSQIYAQLIDDLAGHTLVAANSLQGIKGANKTATGMEVGQKLAEAAKAAGIESAVFDRNGYRYQGRVKAVAEGARKGGLQF